MTDVGHRYLISAGMTITNIRSNHTVKWKCMFCLQRQTSIQNWYESFQSCFALWILLYLSYRLLQFPSEFIYYWLRTAVKALIIRKEENDSLSQMLLILEHESWLFCSNSFTIDLSLRSTRRMHFSRGVAVCLLLVVFQSLQHEWQSDLKWEKPPVGHLQILFHSDLSTSNSVFDFLHQWIQRLHGQRGISFLFVTSIQTKSSQSSNWTGG